MKIKESPANELKDESFKTFYTAGVSTITNAIV